MYICHKIVFMHIQITYLVEYVLYGCHLLYNEYGTLVRGKNFRDLKIHFIILIVFAMKIRRGRGRGRGNGCFTKKRKNKQEVDVAVLLINDTYLLISSITQLTIIILVRHDIEYTLHSFEKSESKSCNIHVLPYMCM